MEMGLQSCVAWLGPRVTGGNRWVQPCSPAGHLSRLAPRPALTRGSPRRTPGAPRFSLRAINN